jgi:hypothetical protein
LVVNYGEKELFLRSKKASFACCEEREERAWRKGRPIIFLLYRKGLPADILGEALHWVAILLFSHSSG